MAAGAPMHNVQDATSEIAPVVCDYIAHATPDLAATPEAKPLRIWLVEDTTSDALLTRKALTSCQVPYSLQVLKKGEELIPCLQHYPHPNLILLDFGLPDMDGFEVLAQLAQQPATIRAIPIVIVTGYTDFEYVREIYPLHILGYLNKPCGTEEIQALLLRVQQAEPITPSL